MVAYLYADIRDTSLLISIKYGPMAEWQTRCTQNAVPLRSSGSSPDGATYKGDIMFLYNLSASSKNNVIHSAKKNNFEYEVLPENRGGLFNKPRYKIELNCSESQWKNRK